MKKILLTTITLIFYICSYAQGPAVPEIDKSDSEKRIEALELDIYYKMFLNYPREYESALLDLKEIRALYLEAERNDEYISTYFYEFLCHYGLKEYSLSKKTLEKVPEKMKTVGLDTSSVWKLELHYYDAELQSQFEDFDNAKSDYTKALILLEKGIQPKTFLKGDIYNNLGLLLENIGDYEGAIKYHKHVLNNANLPFYQINSRQNIGAAYLFLEEYDKAFTYLEDALKLLKAQNNDEGFKDLLITIYANKAECLNNLSGNSTEVLENINSALSLNPPQELLAEIYIEYGSYFLNQGNVRQAMVYFDSTLRIRQRIFPDKHQHRKVAMIYKKIGDAYSTHEPKDKAVFYYDKALEALPRKSISINSKDYALWILEAKAATLNELGEKRTALEIYQHAVSLMDSIGTNFIFARSSNYFWQKRAKQLYEKAVFLALELEEEVIAYNFVVKSHGALLWKGIQETMARNVSTVADSLKQEDLQLRIAISDIELALWKDRDDASKVGLLEKELLKKERDLEQFRASVFQESSAQYDLSKYSSSDISISTVQNTLANSKTALLEYFITQDSLYIFAISKNKFKIYCQTRPATLIDNIKDLKDAISIYSGEPEDCKKFAASAWDLYQAIFAPLLEDFKNIKEWVVIRDEELNYIPFEVLLEKEENISGANYDLSYLVKKYDFSYNYSTNLFLELAQRKSKPYKGVLGFAPVFDGQPGTKRDGYILDSLPYSLEEVQHIDKIMNGSLIFEKKTAKLRNFYDFHPKYSIGHFATHAECNDTFPYAGGIHFDDKMLSFNEIFNLPLDFEMVVLSACKTGIGILKRGEGMISLASTFMRSGCPAVIPSLWEVNDMSTSHLMEYFYSHIKDGQAKHIALGNAQRTYLGHHNQHPFYWAAFIQIGNTNPIPIKTTYPWWIIGFGLLMGLCLYWMYRKRNKRHFSN